MSQLSTRPGPDSRPDQGKPVSANEAPAAVRGMTVCVINHNGERYLADSLDAALTHGQECVEVLLIDDASGDRSVELVREKFPAVRIIRLDRNLGPGAARNLGLREASTDLVLFLDNDVRLAPGCGRALATALARHPLAVVAMPSVIYADRPDTVQYNGADCHFLGLQILRGQNLPVSALDTDIRAMSSLVTACFLVDRERMPPAASFDEDLFFQFEDHDFGVRLRALGGELLSVPQARCYHGLGSVGISIRQLGRYSQTRVLGLIRNRWALMLKTWSLKTLLLLAPLFAVYETAQIAMVIRKGWLREWLRAASWIVAHRDEILQKRRQLQRARRVPDRLLLQAGPLPFRRELATGFLERGGERALNALATLYWRLVKPLV